MNTTQDFIISNYYDKIKPLLSHSNTEIARILSSEYDIHPDTIRKYARVCRAYSQGQRQEDRVIMTDKKKASTSWREIADYAIGGQKIKEKYRYSQSFAKITIQSDTPIVLLPLGDLHIGAIGTDYELFMRITDEILETPELYVMLAGDELELAIKMRNVKEVTKGQILDPEMQVNFFESWLAEIKHKVLWATWGNHVQDREEKVTGFSLISRIIGHDHNLIYHNGIGHVDLTINDNTYHIVSSHKFLGRSYLNPLHSQQRYMRFEGHDREIAIAGDSHKPGIMQYFDGDVERLAVNTATLNVGSGYAKRYFSLFTMPVYPVIEFGHQERVFTGYMSLKNWAGNKRNSR